MKTQKYILFAIATWLLITSCKKDFLDVPITNVVTRQAYVVDIKTTEHFLNGIYIYLARIINSTGLNYPEVTADNIKPITGSPVLTAAYSWSQVADDSKPDEGISMYDPNSNGLWMSGIRMAGECSFVIASADKYKDEDPLLANNLKGQAYALRAFIHWMMTNTFAQSYSFTPDASHPGVPYTKTVNWTDPAVRLSVSKVYEAMIADLDNAISFLPDQQKTRNGFSHSLISKNAAKAILARVYLFKGDWLGAKNLAVELSTAVPLMAGPDNYPSKLFTNEETEAIFQLPPSDPGASQSAGTYYTNFGATLYTGGDIHLVATGDVAELLREYPDDLRSSWIGDSVLDEGISITKFPSDVIPDFANPLRSYYQTLIRSSEMYLIAAESCAKLNQENDARQYLNAIRTRANIEAIPATTTGSSLLESIYRERRRELAFEGFRMYDIQRWKQAVKRTDAPIPTAVELPYGSNAAIAPIPVSDVQMLGMQQNAGY